MSWLMLLCEEGEWLECCNNEKEATCQGKQNDLLELTLSSGVWVVWPTAWDEEIKISEVIDFFWWRSWSQRSEEVSEEQSK